MEQTPASAPETVIEDSIQAAMLETLGCTVLPETDSMGHVQFRVIGDIDGCIKKLYENHPVGSMDCATSYQGCATSNF